MMRYQTSRVHLVRERNSCLVIWIQLDLRYQ